MTSLYTNSWSFATNRCHEEVFFPVAMYVEPATRETLYVFYEISYWDGACSTYEGRRGVYRVVVGKSEVK
jgi:hypothetical protein